MYLKLCCTRTLIPKGMEYIYSFFLWNLLTANGLEKSFNIEKATKPSNWLTLRASVRLLNFSFCPTKGLIGFRVWRRRWEMSINEQWGWHRGKEGLSLFLSCQANIGHKVHQLHSNCIQKIKFYGFLCCMFDTKYN